MRSNKRGFTVVDSTFATLAGLALLLYACSGDPTSTERVITRTVPGSVATPAAVATAESDGGFSTNGALLGKLPSTDTVTSSVPAFEIKQKGGGIAGRFEITNSQSAAIALDGVNSGSGHALL